MSRLGPRLKEHARQLGFELVGIARAKALLLGFVAAIVLALSMAFENWSEARGSLAQLLLNVAILIAIGAAGLDVQRRIWRRVAGRARPTASV